MSCLRPVGILFMKSTNAVPLYTVINAKKNQAIALKTHKLNYLAGPQGGSLQGLWRFGSSQGSRFYGGNTPKNNCSLHPSRAAPEVPSITGKMQPALSRSPDDGFGKMLSEVQVFWARGVPTADFSSQNEPGGGWF